MRNSNVRLRNEERSGKQPSNRRHRGGIAIGMPVNGDHGAVDPLIRDAEGAALLGCSKATWWRRVADGTLPPAIKIGGMARWKLSDVLEVIDRASEQRKT